MTSAVDVFPLLFGLLVFLNSCLTLDLYVDLSFCVLLSGYVITSFTGKNSGGKSRFWF